MSNLEVLGQLVDIRAKKIYPAKITVENGKIKHIEELDSAPAQYLMPGFIDSHIHIESSMLVPSEFARIAVKHGTVATVSDPHEIANVLGIEGVEFMIENGNRVPFKFYFGAPSCVPATAFETAGATIDAAGVEKLLAKPEIKYLAEMMNWPGVLYQDEEVYAKLAAAKKAGKPIDGHAPGLKGEQAAKYASAGISTDHECFTEEEALDKLKAGMKIIIREGSAAKNFEALIPLMEEHYANLMFCSDDKHPDELLLGHINQLVSRAVAKGHDVFNVLQAACLNPIDHYNLEVGKLQKGDAADFIVVEDLKSFEVKETYIDGQAVWKGGRGMIKSVQAEEPNQFHSYHFQAESLRVKKSSGRVRVIVPKDGELITQQNTVAASMLQVDDEGFLNSKASNNILKIAVVNRYREAPPAVAFIDGFGLTRGAIASTVAHDSHNIIAVGVSDEAIAQAINELMESKGGIVAIDGEEVESLPLPVAGLMSTADAKTIGEGYAKADRLAKKFGSTLSAPFMTLSFMALLVIPSLKLSDKGLFNGEKFEFEELQP